MEDLNQLLILNEKDLCELSLKRFIQQYWHVLEPGRQMVDGRVIDAICEHLEAVSDNEIRRLLINVPPGTMKSSIANVFWPAWELGPRHEPWRRYISISYSQPLTRRDNRKCKSLLLNESYQNHWPHTRLSSDEKNIDKWSTTQAGFRIATSIGGRVLGERGDRLILDDPNNIVRMEGLAEIDKVIQFLTEILPTRINDPLTSAIVVIMQRLHERDASGHIISAELGYEHLMLPMFYEKERHCKTCIGFEDWRTEEDELLWPERFPRHYLETDLLKNLRSYGGEYAVAGQMQQRPVPRRGGMFHKDDFIIIEPWEAPLGGFKVRAWDLAATSVLQNPAACYTTGVLIRYFQGLWYVEEVVRERVDENELIQFVVKTAQRDGHGVNISIPQDPAAAGKMLKNAFAKALVGYKTHFSPETGSKINRAIPVAAQSAENLIKVYNGAWVDPYRSEVGMFPNGTYSDQVDATSRGFHYLLKFNRLGPYASPQVYGINQPQLATAH